MSARTTKKARAPRRRHRSRDEFAHEYRFDYRKSRAKRFARHVTKDSVVIVLDADVAKVFRDSKRVNSLLRATIAAVRKGTSRRAG